MLSFYLSITSVSGLAVKFDVAIVEPPVRLRANAYFLVSNLSPIQRLSIENCR